FAGTGVEQRRVRAPAPAEQQLGLAGAEVVQVVVGGKAELVQLGDDDALGIQRQVVDQLGGTGELEATLRLLADPELARVVGERLFEVIVAGVGQVRLGDEGLGRAGNAALSAATQLAGPLLAARSEA